MEVVYTHYEVTDEKAIDRVLCSRGLHSGLSPEMSFDGVCSLCHENYANCPHEPGQSYDGRIAIVEIRNVQFLGTALVEQPRQEGTRVTKLFIPCEDVPPGSRITLTCHRVCRPENSGKMFFEGFVATVESMSCALNTLLGEGCWNMMVD